MGFRLPASYRNFLENTNGGRPVPDTIDIDDLLGSPTDIQVFFGINQEEETSDLRWNFHLVKDRYPNFCMLPIACDSGGSLFCLMPTQNDLMPVVYLDYSDSDDTIYHVAFDFEEFLSKIRDF